MGDETLQAEFTSLLKALSNSRDRLAAALSALDADGAGAQSYDDDWSVAQVASHLGSGAEIFYQILEAGLNGSPAPGMDVNAPIWDRWNGLTPMEQVTEAMEYDARYVDRVARSLTRSASAGHSTSMARSATLPTCCASGSPSTPFTPGTLLCRLSRRLSSLMTRFRTPSTTSRCSRCGQGSRRRIRGSSRSRRATHAARSRWPLTPRDCGSTLMTQPMPLCCRCLPRLSCGWCMGDSIPTTLPRRWWQPTSNSTRFGRRSLAHEVTHRPDFRVTGTQTRLQCVLACGGLNDW